MLEQQEKLWDYQAVEVGQAGNPTTVQITEEHVSRYALLAQNDDPRYQRAGASQEYGGALVAMPTMALTIAPLLRDEIAEACGFVAVEQSRTARRQTPFAKCEVWWMAPMRAGDTITGTRRVLEKYERRGSKFVVFRVEATNQHGQQVATYDYTCIFEYAGGQKKVPTDRGTAQPPAASNAPAMEAGRSARFTSFDALSIGDQLVPLEISESQDIINNRNELRLAGKPSPSNIHTDEEFARKNIFGGTVNAGPAAMSYVDQMLQLSFPLRSFYDGGRLLMRVIEPFRSGDTVTFQGEVTDKQVEDSKKVVACRVKGTNQRGSLVCLSDATLVMPE